MELRHMRYLLAVADELSFTRAAERIHVAQPALSVQIARLEVELGVQLFDRTRRKIRLTEAGQVMADEAREIIRAVDRAVELVQRVGDGVLGRLSIGFVPSASNAALPPLLRSFKADYPDVALELREMDPDRLVSALVEGRLDVCFLYLPFADPTLDQAVVVREEFIVALPHDHRLAECRAVDVAELREEPFVLPARHGMPGLLAQVLSICRDAGFSPHSVQDDVWLVQTIVGLVAAGTGVALVPASARVLVPAGVVYRPLVGIPERAVELAAIWRHGDTSSVLLRFLDMIRERREDAPAVSNGPQSTAQP
jgi:DNA-binding transcriptional LysR family regulator